MPLLSPVIHRFCFTFLKRSWSFCCGFTSLSAVLLSMPKTIGSVVVNLYLLTYDRRAKWSYNQYVHCAGNHEKESFQPTPFHNANTCRHLTLCYAQSLVVL